VTDKDNRTIPKNNKLPITNILSDAGMPVGLNIYILYICTGIQ